jgi:hypothetical protein
MDTEADHSNRALQMTPVANFPVGLVWIVTDPCLETRIIAPAAR